MFCLHIFLLYHLDPRKIKTMSSQEDLFWWKLMGNANASPFVCVCVCVKNL